MEPDNITICRALVAFHQPNPMTATLLARIMGIAPDHADTLLDEVEQQDLHNQPVLFEEVVQSA
jgi:hypothetical protein